MILRFCICIPTYNNPGTVRAVLKDCLERTPYPILIIDDGSTVPLQLDGLLNTKLKHDRVTLIRFDSNQGKGLALQAGIRECLKRDYTHMISLDADGQHLASEVQNLVTVSLEHPWDLVIGSRRMLSTNVPEVSKFGRKFSNFWVRFQTSHPISDSQSGFRIYPLFHVQNIRFWTKNFDFEIEVLIRLLWRGVNVRETEIECYYPSHEDRVSHFHKFWDNLRISCLNTVLVILSLLRSHYAPREIGFAVGAGVWIGCTPFFGLHALIAAGIALIFRLNAVYLLLGTQISIPPIAPFLALASLGVGSWITGKHSGSATGFSWNWLLGSLIVGAALGVCLGTFSYLMAKSVQKRRPVTKSAWNGRTRGGKVGNGFLRIITRYAGVKVAYAFLIFIVPYFYLFAPKARLSADEYWRIVRPTESWPIRQWRVLTQLFRFAQTLLDRVHQGFHAEPCFGLNSSGMEHILGPLNAGKGLILMSAHVGSWDMAAARLRNNGLGQHFHMVKYEAQGITFDKAKDQADPEHVKKIISNEIQQPLFQIRELLSQGLPVGLMGDRPLGNHFELVSFFGKLAPVDCSPFRIAAACNIPLLFTFGFKGKKNDYDFYASPSRQYRSEGGQEKLLQMLDWAQDFAEELEKIMRKYPEQWFNFFPFWSALPSPPENIEATQGRNYLREELRKPFLNQAGSAPGPRPSDEIESRP